MLLFAFVAKSILASVQIEPLYWNASNPIFSNGEAAELNVHFGEKLDIYCPQRSGYNPVPSTEEPLYLKGFLVSEEDFATCAVSDTKYAKKIFTCNTPDKEKKHTILFQEINPNPFGLTFDRGQAYFLISTSDGTAGGMGNTMGGVCDSRNMKIRIRVSDFTEAKTNGGGGNGGVGETQARSDVQIRPLIPWDRKIDQELVKELELEEDIAQSSGFTIGIIIGAFTVLILIIGGVIGYRWQSRRGDIRKALYIPRPRPASSQVHLTLVPAGTSYPYESRKQTRPMSGILTQNGMLQPAPGNMFQPQPVPCTNVYNMAPAPIVKKDSPSGTYSSRQDSLGETSCGSEMTYLDPGSGGVVEV